MLDEDAVMEALGRIEQQGDRIEHRQRIIIRMLRAIHQEENMIMVDLTEVTAAVEQSVTVEESAIALIDGLATQIAALANAGTADAATQAALLDLTAHINGERDKLASAVTANTPAASATPVADVSAPPVDVPAPAADVPAPPVDAPVADTSAPVVETPVIPTDAAPAWNDAPAPSADAPAPPV